MPDVEINALDDSAALDESVLDLLTEDYNPVVLQLYPYGSAWEFSDAEPMRGLVAMVARESSRVERRGLELLAEFPITSQELLPEWRAMLALDLDATAAEVSAALVARGSGNEPFFVALAAAFGFGLVIRREYDPFLCTSHCRHRLRGRAGFWLYTWTAVINGTPTPALEALILRYAQAHEIVLFEYV